jgi:hypothetical protein
MRVFGRQRATRARGARAGELGDHAGRRAGLGPGLDERVQSRQRALEVDLEGGGRADHGPGVSEPHNLGTQTAL